MTNPASPEDHAEALAARAAADPARAVAAWRRLLAASPDDWQLALELKQDLKAGHHYPDSDPQFRRAARSLPDAPWLDHYSNLYAFHGSDLESIDARARSLLRDRPDDPLLHAICGDVARQRRDWPASVRGFEAAHRLHPAQPHYGIQAEAARRYQSLARHSWPDAGPEYGVWMVNLDRNAERMVEIARQFAGSAIQRVPALEGSRLPAAAVHRLTGDPAAPRGTLGCFLSHAAAWEALLASGHTHGLILEDDVIPLLDLPHRLGGLGLPADFDLCFVNDRMEPRIPAQPVGPHAHPLSAVMRAFHPEENAPGGDAYLLGRAGARKLLDWVALDGFIDHVDWRMLAYALTPTEIASIPAPSLARSELTRLSALVPRDDRLHAFALWPALLRTVGVSSDREDEDRAAAG